MEENKTIGFFGFIDRHPIVAFLSLVWILDFMSGIIQATVFDKQVKNLESSREAK